MFSYLNDKSNEFAEYNDFVVYRGIEYSGLGPLILRLMGPWVDPERSCMPRWVWIWTRTYLGTMSWHETTRDVMCLLYSGLGLVPSSTQTHGSMNGSDEIKKIENWGDFNSLYVLHRQANALTSADHQAYFVRKRNGHLPVYP